MKKRQQWQKPELVVLVRSKPEETILTQSIGPAVGTKRDAQYYLGPAPNAHYGGLARSGRAQYYLGPAPANSDVGPFKSGRAKYCLGPAPAEIT